MRRKFLYVALIAFVASFSIGLFVIFTDRIERRPVELPEVFEDQEWVRVIVNLEDPADPWRGGVVRKDDVARIQRAVLAQLTTNEARVIHVYQTIPGLSLEITRSGYEELIRNPFVSGVGLDLPTKPMSPH